MSTSSATILDASGASVRLASVNWYGAHDVKFVPGGLDQQSLAHIAELVARLGFNSVRLPYSDQLVRENPVVSEGDVAANPDLVGRRAMDVLFATVDALAERGIVTILNNHTTTAHWCCNNDPCEAAWYNNDVADCPWQQSEAQWLENWETVARLTPQRPMVVGVDLRNESRGPQPREAWAEAARTAANRIHAINLAYWALNAQKASGEAESFGLLTEDWSDVVHDFRTDPE